jgi:hypothetical protein
MLGDYLNDMVFTNYSFYMVLCLQCKKSKGEKKKIAEFALLKIKEKAGTITDFEYQRMTELSFEIKEHEIEQLKGMNL